MELPFAVALGAEGIACILSLAGISPEIDGVLVQGEKGTMESTTARVPTDVVHSDPQAEGVA